ncbi:unnamed protein product [Leptidea sinapis]|uniref:Uncharacterized protein n=1 Tax=Leptidea sinapis TaxID=189913 RepID=A0A5E4PQK6_9NEOP|nr:unnamed protein product [Leptidea sinapis]
MSRIYESSLLFCLKFQHKAIQSKILDRGVHLLKELHNSTQLFNLSVFKVSFLKACNLLNSINVSSNGLFLKLRKMIAAK